MLEIVPEIGRANSKPLLTQCDNHFCLHCVDGIKSGLSTPQFGAIISLQCKSPGCVTYKLLGIFISSKVKISKGEFYF